ncbi:MAG: hypothetical protein DI585_00510 [Pseudomonas fluorescens]|nr:MAG: hypothetical protein DI585_00510 [Pseudomonas fluorescens]
MKMSSRIALATAALAVMGGAAAANAQTLETVRVRLPNGQLLSLDSNDWQHDRRVVEYRRYYYEPRERVYVVYNDDHHHHHKHDKHWCPPGQAKKGRC